MNRFYLSLFILVLLLSFGCTGPASSNSQKPIIAVTSYPLYDFTKNVVNEDDFEIWLMLPPGLNAHSYEPTPSDLVKLSKAEVFIYTNDNFEFWANKLQKSVNNPNLLVIKASNQVQLVKPADETLGHVDPHTWLSPKAAILHVKEISQKLSQKYPQKASFINQKTSSYLIKLDSLDYDYANTTKTCNHREMFVSHAAFGYLVKDYNLTQIPIVKNFDPQGDVSLADLQHVIDAAKEKNASHIFFEDFISPKLSESIAREINGTTAIFSPMEAYSALQLTGDSYVDIMSRNLDTLSEALDCG